MLERVSALATARPYKSSILTIAENRSFVLTQAAGVTPDFEGRFAKLAGALPPGVGQAVERDGRTLMRVGPRQFWLIGGEHDDLTPKLAKFCAATPLSHSRTRILLDGDPARAVLAKGIPLDWHESVFTPGTFALTGLHHMPLLVHCTAPQRFHLYAMRTFALCVYEWLIDAALEFAA